MVTVTSSAVATIVGSAPADSVGSRLRLAFLRALRTLLQGIAGAFPTAAAGMAIMTLGYWEAFGYSCLAAAVAALVAFLQNVAAFLPTDPTQKAGEI